VEPFINTTIIYTFSTEEYAFFVATFYIFCRSRQMLYPNKKIMCFLPESLALHIKFA